MKGRKPLVKALSQVPCRKALEKLKKYLSMTEEEAVQAILEELYQEGWREGFKSGEATCDEDPFLTYSGL